MRLRNLVAPMADEPIPASQAKTTFFTAPEPMDTLSAGAVPLASAFMSFILLCASSRFFAPAILIIGDATRNEIAVAIATPAMLMSMLVFGVMARNAMMEPGAGGPERPAPVRVKNRIAAALPSMGAMMTIGFIRIYGK